MKNKLEVLQQGRDQIETGNPTVNWLRNYTVFAVLFISILALSSTAILIRLSEEEISPNATVFDRVAIATLVFGLGNLINAKRYRLSDEKPAKQQLELSHDFWLLLGMALFYIGNQVLWAWSLSQTTVAISTLLLNLTPIFTCLFAWAAWSQQFDNKFLLGMIIAIGGAGAIGVDDLQISTGKLEGDIAAFIAAIFNAGYLLTIEKLRTKLTSTNIMLWCCGLGTLLSLPIFLFSEDQLWPDSVRGWAFVISLAIVGQVLGQGLLAYSLKKFSSGFVALMLLLESVFAAIAAWGIFGESLSLFDWVAFFTILFGMYLAVSSKSAMKE